MNKRWSKLTGVILLSAMLIAGLLLYNSNKRDKTIPADLGPEPADAVMDKPFKFSGIVVKYGSNHEGDIDKLLVETDEKEIWLHFPPHMARLVKSVAMIGKPIDVLVDQKKSPHGPHRENLGELKGLFNNKLEKKVDLSKIPPPIPKEGIEIEIQGIPLIDHNENAFVLAGKVVRLPPHMAHQLFPIINQSRTIFVKGFMRDSTDGFISDSGLPVVKPVSVKIDSVIYKIR